MSSGVDSQYVFLAELTLWKCCNFIQPCPSGDGAVWKTGSGSSQWQPEPGGYPSCSRRLCAVRLSWILSRHLEVGQDTGGSERRQGLGGDGCDLFLLFLMPWKLKCLSWYHRCDWICWVFTHKGLSSVCPTERDLTEELTRWWSWNRGDTAEVKLEVTGIWGIVCELHMQWKERQAC